MNTQCDDCDSTLDADDQCPRCGLDHSDPCPECHRGGLHLDTCSRSDAGEYLGPSVVGTDAKSGDLQFTCGRCGGPVFLADDGEYLHEAGGIDHEVGL